MERRAADCRFFSSGGAVLPYSPEELIDLSVTVDMLVDLLRSRRPFAYLRYGDGEWLSVLGQTGVNGDGHDFFPQTMGRELLDVLEQIARRPKDGQLIFVGTTTLFPELIVPCIEAHNFRSRIPWVSAVPFQAGIADRSTRRFVEAAAAYNGPKYLVASRYLRPVARALGCWHIVVPPRDCYEHLDWVEPMLRFSGPGLVLCCASMASECLIWRLLLRNPEATYVDCGSIFDGMLGRCIRHQYTEYRDLLAREYFPLFRDYVEPRTEKA